MGQSSRKLVVTDIDKRPLSKYYSKLSAVFSDHNKPDVYLQNVKNLADPASNRRIKKLVRKGILKNVNYTLDDPKKRNFKLVKTQEEFIKQYDGEYIHFNSSDNKL